MKLTPAEAADKQVRRLQGATEDMRRGIEAVTVAPTEQAAAKQDKMLNNLTQAVVSGKWAAGLRRVDLGTWKDRAIVKGLPRVGPGIQAARPKVEAFFSKLFPHQEALQKKVKGMADLTIEDSANRMVAWMKGMADFKQ
jgi:hypothetical protein